MKHNYTTQDIQLVTYGLLLTGNKNLHIKYSPRSKSLGITCNKVRPNKVKSLVITVGSYTDPINMSMNDRYHIHVSKTNGEDDIYDDGRLLSASHLLGIQLDVEDLRMVGQKMDYIEKVI